MCQKSMWRWFLEHYRMTVLHVLNSNEHWHKSREYEPREVSFWPHTASLKLSTALSRHIYVTFISKTLQSKATKTWGRIQSNLGFSFSVTGLTDGLTVALWQSWDLNFFLTDIDHLRSLKSLSLFCAIKNLTEYSLTDFLIILELFGVEMYQNITS